MKKIYIYVLAVMSLLCSSCNDWLDVQPETEVPADKMFDNYKGFKDALTGCYISMVDRSAYGEKLTMTSIECLANLWMIETEKTLPADYYLESHDYEQTNAKDTLKSIYAKMYNIIVQSNVIIKNVAEKGNSITDPVARAVVEAEAYGLRAYCHLDILRLFGQVPGGTIKVSLPYSETTTIDEMPIYYDFDAFVKKIEADLSKAESLLKDNDPIFEYTFEDLNSVGSSDSKVTLNDTYLAYRQFRMNYWAVKALKARLYLYIGENQKAHDIAMEIINAKGADGLPVMVLSGSQDIKKGYYACPSECLFALSCYRLIDYSKKLLGGDITSSVTDNEQYIIDEGMLDDLFKGQNTSSHNRYVSVWEKTKNGVSTTRPSIKKYFYKKDDFSDKPSVLTNKLRIIPMIRMSEIYLIAIEATTNLSEANSLYKTYMESHDVLITSDAFSSLQDVKNKMQDEYRREFFAEGQMFYTYKRNKATKMLWGTGEVSENDYIVPLPDTEYNSNK